MDSSCSSPILPRSSEGLYIKACYHVDSPVVGQCCYGSSDSCSTAPSIRTLCHPSSMTNTHEYPPSESESRLCLFVAPLSQSEPEGCLDSAMFASVGPQEEAGWCRALLYDISSSTLLLLCSVPLQPASRARVTHGQRRQTFCDDADRRERH